LVSIWRGQNSTIFTKIGTKLTQKLKYWEQIENKEMKPGIIVTRDKFFIF